MISSIDENFRNLIWLMRILICSFKLGRQGLRILADTSERRFQSDPSMTFLNGMMKVKSQRDNGGVKAFRVFTY